MKKLSLILSFIFIVVIQASCNNQQSKKMLLTQCKTLAEESILYARASYVKLFYEINPDKFLDSYSKVKDFNYVSHRNTINTYDMAVRKLKAKDPVSKSFLDSCKALSEFTQYLVDQAYPQAISFKNTSKLNPRSDDFFLEINKMIKFDRNIGHYKKGFISFKEHVKNYEVALKQYVGKYKTELLE